MFDTVKRPAPSTGDTTKTKAFKTLQRPDISDVEKEAARKAKEKLAKAEKNRYRCCGCGC